MFGMIPYTRREANLYRYMNELEKNFFNTAMKNASALRCDITEKDDQYLLEAELPGFNKEDIRVELEGDILSISATHQENEEEKDNQGNYVRRERRYGSFSRSFDVSGIDAENIKAEYKNGILQLELPKKPELKPETRKIEIAE